MKKQNGITLIALVITIIVMLILVGVSVTVALNGGLFTTAKDAVNETKIKRDEELKLSEGKVQINGEWYDSMAEYANGSGNGGQQGGSTNEVAYQLRNFQGEWDTLYAPSGTTWGDLLEILDTDQYSYKEVANNQILNSGVNVITFCPNAVGGARYITTSTLVADAPVPHVAGMHTASGYWIYSLEICPNYDPDLLPSDW